MKFFTFHYSNSIMYLIYFSLSCLIVDIITECYEIVQYNLIFDLLLMYIGESLAIFFYLYEKSQFIQKTERIKVFNEKKKKNNKYMIIFILFWCTSLDLIGTINIEAFYTNDMINIKGFDYFESALICLFIFLNECYYLKIETYIHQKLGVGIDLFCLFFSFIYILLKENFDYKLSSFLYVLILKIQSTYLQSFLYVFEKRLNYEYYVNINLICFSEGIIGIIILLIFDLLYNIISVKVLKKETYFVIQKETIPNDNKNLYFFIFIIIPIYCFSLCVLNVSRLKIAEKKRPTYVIIGKALTNLFISIVDIIRDKDESDTLTIINMIFGVLGSLIFCEIITLHFCGLDKNTLDLTSMRAKSETDISIIELQEFQNQKDNDEIDFIPSQIF